MTSLTFVGLLLAVGAGIGHAVLGPAISIADTHPNLALVATVLVATLSRFEAGLVWAFACGLAANLVVREPLGALPLGMLAAAGMTVLLARLLSRARWAAVGIAALAGSFGADGAVLLTRAVLGEPIPAGDLAGVLLRSAFLNAALALVALAPAAAIARRVGPGARQAW